MILRFTWSPNPAQMGDAARLAVADPDCDVELKEIKVKELTDRGIRRVQQRLVNGIGIELNEREVHRALAAYIVPELGVSWCPDGWLPDPNYILQLN